MNLTPVKSTGEGSLNYLRIVALHISGHSREVIAEQLGITPATVTNALKSREGQAILEDAKRRMRENVFGRLESEILVLAERGVQNIRQTMEANFALGSRGKIHQDQVSLKMLGIIGYTEDSMSERRKTAGAQLNDDLAKALLKAIDKADASAAVHGGRDITALAENGTRPASN
jgi:predicted transcriptional regulator